MPSTYQDILNKLPYTAPFLFVDGLDTVSQTGVVGHYTFTEDADFYKGHFVGFPVTPGVILTECMAQIGLVCLGLFLMADTDTKASGVALSNTSIDFYKPVYPKEKIQVISEKIYFRFGKLKCKVRMLNAKEEVVALGEISGMITQQNV